MRYEQEMQQRWIARRDANAFTELVQQHAGMVFATCRRVLGDATEAEDVAQECFMELAGATKVVKPSLGGWLHRVAVFRSLNRIRADHRRKLREKTYTETHSVAAEAAWDDIKPHLD
jgi:DNA-directed RNA polymerase specialized sigma24 family protein